MIAVRAMVGIDALVVLVALPAMQRGLDASGTDVQWFVSAFLIPYAGFVALGGRIGDSFGHVRFLRMGIVLFIAASVAGAFAESPGWLITARACQGAGAAFVRPNAETVLASQFERRERGRAVGIASSASTLAVGLAPLLGGLLTTTASWRAVFFVNLPLGLVCLAALHVLPPADHAERTPVPWSSAPLLVLGMGGTVFAVSALPEWGIGSAATLGVLCGSLAVALVTVVRELRSENPLIDFRLFALRSFGGSVGMLATLRFSAIGFQVLTVLWVQDVLGLSAVEAGLLVLPLSLPVILCGPLGGLLYDRAGPRTPVVLGGALVFAGTLCAALTVRLESSEWLIGCCATNGVGVGLAVAPLFTEAFNVTPAALRGQAEGVVQTTRELGGALGIAVLGAVFVHVRRTNLAGLIEQDGRIPMSRLPLVERSVGQFVALDRQRLPAGVPADLLPDLKAAVTQAVAAAFFVASSVVLVASVVSAFLLSRAEPEKNTAAD
ncbi:MFS transporter [Streptomyces solincola]|nr:MFS transporter [Streptomyces solincola]